MWKSCKFKPSLHGAMLIATTVSLEPVSAKQAIELEGARFPTWRISKAGIYSQQGVGILKWDVWFDIYA